LSIEFTYPTLSITCTYPVLFITWHTGLPHSAREVVAEIPAIILLLLLSILCVYQVISQSWIECKIPLSGFRPWMVSTQYNIIYMINGYYNNNCPIRSSCKNYLRSRSFVCRLGGNRCHHCLLSCIFRLLLTRYKTIFSRHID